MGVRACVWPPLATDPGRQTAHPVAVRLLRSFSCAPSLQATLPLWRPRSTARFSVSRGWLKCATRRHRKSLRPPLPTSCVSLTIALRLIQARLPLLPDRSDSNIEMSVIPKLFSQFERDKEKNGQLRSKFSKGEPLHIPFLLRLQFLLLF